MLTSLGSFPRSGIAGSKDYCMFNVLSNYFLNCFLKWLHCCTFLPAVYEATVSDAGWFWVEACRLQFLIFYFRSSAGRGGLWREEAVGNDVPRSGRVMG